MRTASFLAALMVTVAGGPAVQAQVTNDTGIPTETQERLRTGTIDVPWLDLLGLLGLFGLLGLRRPHAEDSYHPAPVE